MKIESVAQFMKGAAGALKHLSERSPTTLGFNVFELMSDSYQMENFHSDVLSAILDPNSKHNEGALFLRLFLRFLEKVAVIQGKIDVANKLIHLRTDGEVCISREKGRIDILVEFDNGAIVIENKINGADDMVRQLPRYVEYVEREPLVKKEVVAIVYLTSTEPKEPNPYCWTKTDKDKVMSRLLSVVGFSEAHADVNLVQGWLEPCQLSSTRFSSLAVLSQYCELLRNQAGVTMDNIILKELLSQMAKNGIDYFELKEAIEKMPHGVASLIIEDCAGISGLKKKPWIAYDEVAVFDFESISISKSDRVAEFAVDVHCEDLGRTGISFFARSGNNVPITRYLPLLKSIDSGFKFDTEIWEERLVLQIPPKKAYADVKALIGKVAHIVEAIVQNRDSLSRIAGETNTQRICRACD